MANPFKEAENKKKVAPGGEHEVQHREVEPPKVEKPLSTENPLAGMIEPKSKNGKACGFYLSEEAIEKLERLAKQNKCSKSKALDVLLRSL